MKIYDISQEVFSCNIYPDDPKPIKERIKSMDSGEVYNLTSFSMCAHNGTHVDAPFHFIKDGKTIDKIHLEAFIGMSYIAEHNGPLLKKDALEIINKASMRNVECAKRILLKGDVEVSLEAAEVFAKANILLLGNESQTIGQFDNPMDVHITLLKENIILLEGINLSEVNEGVYFLHAAPLNLAGADGAPCRATLIDFNK